MSATTSVSHGQFDPSVSDLQAWAALGGGAALVLFGASRRPLPRLCLTLAGISLLYRGLSRTWPDLGIFEADDDTRSALSGERGTHVREAVQLEKPIEEVYQFWRRLENLPRFMSHLEAVTDHGDGRSHWVARGPAGVRVEWDAEIINESANQVIAWRSLPGSDVVSAGSVNFDRVRGGRGTQITVHLQYDGPAGRAGTLVATLLGREPSQTIREDLRRLKQLLETGEIAQATTSSTESSAL